MLEWALVEPVEPDVLFDGVPDVALNECVWLAVSVADVPEMVCVCVETASVVPETACVWLALCVAVAPLMVWLWSPLELVVPPVDASITDAPPSPPTPEAGAVYE